MAILSKSKSDYNKFLEKNDIDFLNIGSGLELTIKILAKNSKIN